MALRTNSKQACENIRNYIVNHYTPYDFDDDTPEANARTFPEIATVIYNDVIRVEGWRRNRGFIPFEKLFSEWASGLPNILDTCYYYNRSAVDDLGEILAQNETERNRFSQTEAEEMLSRLIAREIVKVVR